MSSPDLGKAHVEKWKPNRVSDYTSSVYTNRKSGVTDKRMGRGYSHKEIAEAFANIGLQNQNISKVRAFRIPVDNLRRSVHQENVTKVERVLKSYFQSKKTKNEDK